MGRVDVLGVEVDGYSEGVDVYLVRCFVGQLVADDLNFDCVDLHGSEQQDDYDGANVHINYL